MRPIGILLILALILATLPQFAHAIGIAPGHIDLKYQAGSEETVTIKITNSDGTPVKVTFGSMGELESGIVFSEPSLEMKDGEKERMTTITVKMPAGIDKPGTHTTSIVATATPVSGNSQNVGMTASVAVICQLNVLVPYPGKYAELSIYAPAFQTGVGSNFVAEIRNLGTEDLAETRVVIDIYGQGMQKVATLSTESLSIPAKSNKQVAIQWTPSLEAGPYRAEAKFIYEGGNAVDNKEITVGTMLITFEDMKARAFKLGDVAVFDVYVKSKWNQDIPDVFIDGEVHDSDGKFFTHYRTSSIDLKPKEMQLLPVYWDTRNAGPGDYTLNLVLNYAGKTEERDYKIKVSLDKIETEFTGQAITNTPGSDQNTMLKWMIGLTFLIVVLIGFNVVIYLRSSKKKNEK